MNVSRTKRILRVAFGCTAALGILIVANAMQFAETSVVAQPTELYGVEAARAHAAQYADPNYFTQPAVVDIYQDIFLGRPTSQTNASYTTGDAGPSFAAERQTVACYAGDCSPASPGRAEICASAYGGSFLMIGPGDTFYVGEIGRDGFPTGNTPDATKVKTHSVVSVSPGSGAADCAAGTWILTVYPWIDYIAEGVQNGASLSPVWRDSFHPTGGAAYLIGYKLGWDTRDTWGAQGHNLIPNPGFQGSAGSAVSGWEVTAGTIDSYPYDIGNGSTKPSPGALCNSGDGIGYESGSQGYDCVATSAGQGAEVVQTGSIPVNPGERYILSGLISTGSTSAYYGLADDRDGDGTWILSDDLKVTLTDSQAKTDRYRVPRWSAITVTIPDGVHAVRFLYHVASSLDWLDFVSMRRQTGYADSLVVSNFLMHDPGSRNIVFMGDSWFDPSPQTPYAPYFKQGLQDAFAARGISIPPGQVRFTGAGGDTTGTILSKLPNVLATHKPLYIVLDGGINDAYAGTAYPTTMANFKEMARLSVQAGAIPIFLSPPPAARLNGSPVFGAGSMFAALHALREGLRNWVFGLDNDWCGAADEVLFTTCGLGPCTRAALACIDGVPQTCTPGTSQPELCNGVDDNCNGVIDDGGGSVLCNDASACTDDRCDGVSGCTHTNNDANPCSDGDACTTGDACGGGTCTPGAPTVCDDSNACTTDSCNPATGDCVFPNNANPCSDGNVCTDDACDPTTGDCLFSDNVNPCSDGNACTTGDTCGGGTCDPGATTACNDNNVCTTDSCNPATGCVFANNANACSDGSACTAGDICGGGACNPGAPTVCNDNNVCTSDSCSPATGCVFANNVNACSDGNACTAGDICGGGACNPGAATACNDNNVCTTDSCNPATGCVFAHNANACNDGNACTTGDTCGVGTCNQGAATVCNDSNVCTTDSCTPATGCFFTNNANACSDGNACTTGDTCGGGACNPGAATVCNDNKVCTTDSCNPATGACVFTNNTNPCSDGNACTTGDTCGGGTCTPGGPTNCNDSNPCTNDSCNSSDGCRHTNNNQTCSDGNACTAGDICGGGTCQPGTATVCNDNNVCTTDNCNPATGCASTNNTSACSDGNPCTAGDTCGGGTCTPGGPTNCNDNNPCTNDSCSSSQGCKNTNNTVTCNDNNACTSGDICGGGTCRPGASVTCNDSNVCTTDSCNPATGCVFANNVNACSDGNACTAGDTCGGGACNPGAPTACNDSNVCTTDSCNPATGCVFASNVNACNDGNACTAGDTCGGGTCNPGAPTVCNDNNVCTTDSCNPATGACAFTNNANACSDGNACTAGDTCGSGTCNPGAATACNDSNVCTTDSCNPATGCVFTNNANACSDGNACTTGDTCDGGTCEPAAPIVCTDDNACTTDSCNPATGCVFANNTDSCDDGNACTQSDACQAGSCVGIPPPVPQEVDDGVEVSGSALEFVVTWNVAAGATTSELLRGSLGGLPVGPLDGDETCLGNVTGTAFTDNTVPPADGGFWYLVRGANACQATGPWGFQGIRGAPGVERTSTTCP